MCSSDLRVVETDPSTPLLYLGPFNPRSSRNTYSSGVLGSVSTTRDLPFTFSEIRAITSSLPQRAGVEPLRPLDQDSESTRIWVYSPEPNVHPVFPEWKHRCFVKWAPGGRSQREPARSASALLRKPQAAGCSSYQSVICPAESGVNGFRANARPKTTLRFSTRSGYYRRTSRV